MRITREVDYAFRIVSNLARSKNNVVAAPQIADEEEVPLRFTLRILRKLNQAGITDSIRGARGGYKLKMSSQDISLYDIILAVDGPIIVNNCLDGENPDCLRKNKQNGRDCKFHNKLASIQSLIIEQFSDAKIIDFI
ncbi:Rrf2 family transcriptional regulator [Peptoniphilus sp. GNH]|nr:Rrf2 family transcriptional regulator [Peptoniphilus sp. GNH]